MSASTIQPPPSRRARALRFIAGAHLLRTLGLLVFLMMVTTVLYRQGAPAWLWTLDIVTGLGWPHLARVQAQLSADPIEGERRNVLIDALLCGIWIVLLRFNLLPSVIMLTMPAMNCIMLGGSKLLLRGLLAETCACGLTIMITGFPFEPTTDMLEIVGTIPFLVFFPLALSANTYLLGRRVRQQNRLLRQISSVDGLSELLNRSHWEEAVAGVLENLCTDGRSASLLLIDIDHFKQINDLHGHTVGDEVIGRIGAIIRRSMREGDIAGRYGGDEFGVVLNGVSATMAAQIGERIRASVHAASFEQATDLRCTLSIGIAQADENIHNTREWIKRADEALYNAKLQGRNRLAIATGVDASVA